MIYANIIVFSILGVSFAGWGSNTHSRMLGVFFLLLGMWNVTSLFK